MFIDGLKLMVIGMGAVFLFLTIMVIVISSMAKLLAPFAGILAEKQRKKAAKKTDYNKAGSGNDTVLMAAAAAAVHKHRST